MPIIIVEELRERVENDIEHEVAFRWGGRRLIARVLLSNVSDREVWAPGTSHDVQLRLVRMGNAVKMAPNMRPGIDDEDHAMWRAIGPVLRVDTEEHIVTVDVGFPIDVDMDPVRGQPELTPKLVVGDSVAVRGELRVTELEDD